MGFIICQTSRDGISRPVPEAEVHSSRDVARRAARRLNDRARRAGTDACYSWDEETTHPEGASSK